MKENIEEARDKGLKILGISDHAENMPGTASYFHFKNMRVIKEEIMGVRVLKGIEANIIDFEGRIDVQEDLALELDYIIASLHPPCIEPGNIEENTNALIKVMSNPNVKVIGHPDDDRYGLDYEKLVLEAKKKNMVFEINNSSLTPGSFRENAEGNQKKLLLLCKEHGVKVIMGSDAHICYDVGEFSYCQKLLEEVQFPEELVLNFSLDSLEYILNRKVDLNC